MVYKLKRSFKAGTKTVFFNVLTAIKNNQKHRRSSALKRHLLQSGSARQLRENNFSGPLQAPINNKPLHEMDAIFFRTRNERQKSP